MVQQRRPGIDTPDYRPAPLRVDKLIDKSITPLWCFALSDTKDTQAHSAHRRVRSTTLVLS